VYAISNIRESLSQIATALAKKNYIVDQERFRKLDKARSQSIQKLESLQAERNQLSAGFKNIDDIEKLRYKEKIKKINEDIKSIKEHLETVVKELDDWISEWPNIPDESVTLGLDESQNKVIESCGQPKKNNFQPKDHVQIGQSLKGIDFDLAAKLSGSRFVVLQGAIAKLHRVLAQWMIDTHIEQHGYREIAPPYLVHDKALFGTGQLPKFKEDLFSISEDGLYLIPTAEVPLTGLYSNQKVDVSNPIKLVAHTPCFRREAGAYGQDTRGMIRLHQFDKVELVQIVDQKDAMKQFMLMVSEAEKILQMLDLPYQKVELCTGDLGFSAQKTYDLEVYMASKDHYREISSISLCGEFQARRLNIKDSNKQLVATLNGSGVAVGRCLVAILEYYQSADGMKVHIPKILQPYMDNLQKIDLS
jgi:seryl-tRNA synthetase